MKFTWAFLLFFLSLAALQAQQDDVPRGEEVNMSVEEFQSLARKVATLRARRAAMVQQRQADWQAYYATQRQQRRPARPGRDGRDGRDAQPQVLRQEIEIVRENPVGAVFDTVIYVDPDTYEERIEIIARDPAPRPAARGRDYQSLQDRLDRQEALLQQLLARETASAEPRERDPEVDRILAKQNANQLTQEDYRRLSNNMEDMDREINRLRNELNGEQARRRRAEERMEDALADERRALRRERDATFERDLDRRDNGRNLRPATVRPDVNVDRRPRRVDVVRDTVFVDRTVEAPARPADTVVRVREVIREPERIVVRDTVTNEREVIRENTIQLAAREPIPFPTIFFDNNSATLNATHRAILSTMIDDMQRQPNYRVRLTGYASKSGNAAYNQQLSARRAEAVKQGLQAMGVPENKIRLVAGGIDFGALTPAGGRRVEVLAIPE